MDRYKRLTLSRFLKIGATSGTLLLCSCVTPGTQDELEAPGPDRVEMDKRAEVNNELTKVFAPIDEKAELLESQYR